MKRSSVQRQQVSVINRITVFLPRYRTDMINWVENGFF